MYTGRDCRQARMHQVLTIAVAGYPHGRATLLDHQYLQLQIRPSGNAVSLHLSLQACAISRTGLPAYMHIGFAPKPRECHCAASLWIGL